MWRRPILQAFREGGSGANVFAGDLGRHLVSVTVTDNAGKESDACRIVLADPGRLLPLPRKKEIFTVFMGWADEGPVLQGPFAVQKMRHRGDASSGEFLTIELRAADFVDKLKAFGRKHYEEDATAGSVFSDLAKEAGLGVSIASELAGIKLGYRLRWDQSVIDFATEIAEEIGAVVKPAGGKLVVMKKGAGKSGGGLDLPPIVVRKTAGYSWDIEIEPRPVYGKVTATWLDKKTGRRKLLKQPTGRTGPHHVLPHPYRDEGDARRAAEAEAFEAGNNEGSGSFEGPGLPHARAEAPVIAIGYGEGIDGRWKAESVEKSIDKKSGFKTTVTVKAGKEAKSKD